MCVVYIYETLARYIIHFALLSFQGFLFTLPDTKYDDGRYTFPVIWICVVL